MLDQVEKETFQELADNLKKLSRRKRIRAFEDGYNGVSLRDMMEHFRRSTGQKHKKLGAGTYGTVYEGDAQKNTVYKLFPSTDGYLNWIYFVVTHSHEFTDNARRFLPVIHQIQLVSDGVHPACSRMHSLNVEYNTHIILVELERLEEFRDSACHRNRFQHNEAAIAYFHYGEPSKRVRHNKTFRALKEIYDHPQVPSMSDACEQNCMLRVNGETKRVQLVITDPCFSWTDSQERIDKVERLIA